MEKIQFFKSNRSEREWKSYF